MATTKLAYATAASLTMTIDGIANSALASSKWSNCSTSTAVDNSTNLYLDALVEVKVTSGSSVANDKAVYLYAYGSNDGGTTYTEGMSGTAATGVQINDPTNLVGPITIPTPIAATTYTSGPFSIAALFGGVLPQSWGLVLRNFSGAALGTGSSVKYQGVTATTA